MMERQKEPGPGGYGVLMVFGQHTKELSEGFRKTTNNRMELLFITALESITKPGIDVKIISDSKYCIDSVTKDGCKDGSRKVSKEKESRPLGAISNRCQKYSIQFQWVNT